MISLFKPRTNQRNKIKRTEEQDLSPPKREKYSLTLLPGSEGEHALQDKYGTRQRALRFYDKQIINHLSAVMQEFIDKQEVMFIATADKHGECDCSARFGKPGFVRVINHKYLLYPEYRGNGVLASQGNMLENPHIGLIFVDFFVTTVGLHVNGVARIIDNEQLKDTWDELPEDIFNEMELSGNKRPERWIIIEVEEAYIHCSKHIPLLKKMDKKIDWGTDNVAAKGGDFFQLDQLSFYDRIGGEEAVKKIVNVLYRKIIADPEISHYFEKIEITTQIERLSELLSMLFANQGVFNIENFLEIKKNWLKDGLSHLLFHQMLNHLYSSLDELEVSTDDIDVIRERLESMYN